jgi:DNA-binding ferritin-like protein (Dps family)
MAWIDGYTLKTGMDAVAQKSYKPSDDLGFTWGETVESFSDSLMTDRNQVRAETWRDNYQS